MRRLTITKSGFPKMRYCLRYRMPARQSAFANRFSICEPAERTRDIVKEICVLLGDLFAGFLAFFFNWIILCKFGKTFSRQSF